MAKALKAEEISVVAELRISSALGEETVKSFDSAWHRMLEIGRDVTPVKVLFLGFVRKDS